MEEELSEKQRRIQLAEEFIKNAEIVIKPTPDPVKGYAFTKEPVVGGLFPGEVKAIAHHLERNFDDFVLAKVNLGRCSQFNKRLMTLSEFKDQSDQDREEYELSRFQKQPPNPDGTIGL